MSRWLVDTSAYSAWVRGYAPVRELIEQADALCMSVVMIGELLGGFRSGSRQKQPAKLGHVAFVVASARGHETTVTFLRGNLAFRVRGHGALAAEALPLAARLDERVVGQPPLSLEELRTRSAQSLRRR